MGGLAADRASGIHIETVNRRIVMRAINQLFILLFINLLLWLTWGASNNLAFFLDFGYPLDVVGVPE
jgi:hypothetical protein